MTEREQQLKLAADIKTAIESYETQSGMLVSDISINRAGCTDVPPYRIYGIGVCTRVNSYWKKPS